MTSASLINKTPLVKGYQYYARDTGVELLKICREPRETPETVRPEDSLNFLTEAMMSICCDLDPDQGMEE